MNHIEIEARRVYGNPLFYPANTDARTLAQIAGAKTLSLHHIQLITDLGYEIKLVGDVQGCELAAAAIGRAARKAA